MGKNMKRREFIGKAALGFFSAGLATPFLKKEIASQGDEPKIIYRTLGRTNLRIPIISFGVMNSDSPDLIKRALDRGINHLDSANVYLRGNSERVIGEVLERDGNRDKIHVATKMRFARDNEKNIFLLKGSEREPGATEENLFKQLETSLGRLRTDYVDILYLHSAYSPQMTAFEPLMNALVKARKQGKARFLGVSTHKNVPDVIRATVDAEIYDVVLAAYNYVLEDKEEVKKAIRYAAEKGVGVVAMKTQGGRRLQQDPDVEINHQAALKWVLNDQNVCTTIPGMTTFEQLDLNMGVMNDLTLTGEEQRDLQVAASMRGTLYCQNCRFCVPSCPQDVEVPKLMRAYMYAKGYGNYVQAGMTIAELPEKQGLDVCRECSQCTASCRRDINIGSRVKSLIAEGLYLG
ncbi:MAG: aldo/keto reductase [Candidatus Aminicenantes bacterium]|nr:aldo/keto reductase [Candidatus Aminicenantes bacterium]